MKYCQCDSIRPVGPGFCLQCGLPLSPVKPEPSRREAVLRGLGIAAGGGVEGAGPYTNCTVGGASWKAIAS